MRAGVDEGEVRRWGAVGVPLQLSVFASGWLLCSWILGGEPGPAAGPMAGSFLAWTWMQRPGSRWRPPVAARPLRSAAVFVAVVTGLDAALVAVTAATHRLPRWAVAPALALLVVHAACLLLLLRRRGAPAQRPPPVGAAGAGS